MTSGIEKWCHYLIDVWRRVPLSQRSAMSLYCIACTHADGDREGRSACQICSMRVASSTSAAKNQPVPNAWEFDIRTPNKRRLEGTHPLEATERKKGGRGNVETLTWERRGSVLGRKCWRCCRGDIHGVRTAERNEDKLLTGHWAWTDSQLQC